MEDLAHAAATNESACLPVDLSPLSNSSDSSSDSDNASTGSDGGSSSGEDVMADFLQALLDDQLDPLGTKAKDTPAKPPVKRQRTRGWTKRQKFPYTTSMFYRDYHNPNVQKDGHIDAKEFRLNYRMPWTEVHKLVHLFVRRGWCKRNTIKRRHHIAGYGPCPPCIKILGTLYWLGEGCSFRSIYNLSHRVWSAVSFLNFAKFFCNKVAEFLGPHYIKTPTTLRQLRRVSDQYKYLGFPGACGSTDGVQIAWEGCPFAMRVQATGKEKYPTLGFNVTVDHECRVINVCSVFLGRFTDKTKIRYDQYVDRLRRGAFTGFDYHVLNERGEQTRCTTPYLICDNGYRVPPLDAADVSVQDDVRDGARTVVQASGKCPQGRRENLRHHEEAVQGPEDAVAFPRRDLHRRHLRDVLCVEQQTSGTRPTVSREDRSV